MAAVDPNVLLEESKCYACYDPAKVPVLSRLALLSRISQLSVGPPGTIWKTSYTPAATRNDFTGCAGEQILVGASPITVSAIGCYIAAGGTKIHTLRIANLACVVQGSVSLDFTGKSGFNYVGVTPFVLVPATSYFLYISVVTGEDLWYNNVGTSSVVTPVASLTIGAFNTTGPCPNSTFGAGIGYSGMNFKYTSP